MEPLVAGGAAEAFERHVQQLFRTGYRNLVVDLRGVRMLDSAGIRALVRGHTTGQRVGGTLRLAAAPAEVAKVLELDRLSTQKSRTMSVEILASGRQFPTPHVENIFARNQVVFEPREILQADDVAVKYHTWLDPRMSLKDLSVQLMEEGAWVKSVAWEHPKRERA